MGQEYQQYDHSLSERWERLVRGPTPEELAEQARRQRARELETFGAIARTKAPALRVRTEAGEVLWQRGPIAYCCDWCGRPVLPGAEFQAWDWAVCGDCFRDLERE